MCPRRDNSRSGNFVSFGCNYRDEYNSLATIFFNTQASRQSMAGQARGEQRMMAGQAIPLRGEQQARQQVMSRSGGLLQAAKLRGHWAANDGKEASEPFVTCCVVPPLPSLPCCVLPPLPSLPCCVLCRTMRSATCSAARQSVSTV